MIRNLINKASPLSVFNRSLTLQSEEAQLAAATAVSLARAGTDAENRVAYDAVMAFTEVAFHEGAFFRRAVQIGITSMIPRKALQKVKRYLRRECRKPNDMRVRDYYHYLRHINDEELPHLPPFDPRTQSLSDDELLDIILCATPRSWTREMDRQGFDPLEKSIAEVVGFMEQIETAKKANRVPRTTATTMRRRSLPARRNHLLPAVPEIPEPSVV